jgi:predicted MFS family arabinose efflux permease
MLPVAVVSTVPVATGLFLLGGVIWGPYTTVEAGAIQRWTPPSRHGTAFGLQRALLGTAAPTGAAIGAVAIQYTAPQFVLALSAALCAVAGLLALTPQPCAEHNNHTSAISSLDRRTCSRHESAFAGGESLSITSTASPTNELP